MPRMMDSIDGGRFWVRAVEQLAKARVKFPDEDATNTDSDWIAILAEEFGEVVKAAADETTRDLEDELEQLAAVCARWSEAIRTYGRVKGLHWSRLERSRALRDAQVAGEVGG